MKSFLSVLVAAFAAPCAAQPAATKAAFDMMRAGDVLYSTVERLHECGPGCVEQPECLDVPAGYYVFCITDVGDDYESAAFMVHPVIPVGTTVGDLKGTPSYNNALGAVVSIEMALEECPAKGEYALATYLWDNAAGGAGSGEVTKTSLVKEGKFGGKHGKRGKKGEDGGEQYYNCGIQVAEV